jgi:hypothetical protein
MKKFVCGISIILGSNNCIGRIRFFKFFDETSAPRCLRHSPGNKYAKEIRRDEYEIMEIIDELFTSKLSYIWRL